MSSGDEFCIGGTDEFGHHCNNYLRDEEREPKPEENIFCPFCNQGDFDLIGLRSHLMHGDCKVFNETENLCRI